MPVTTAPETKMRVRHPLDAVRSHIRRYVLLETAAALLLFLALWFWIGMFVDFGSFFALAYDWVLELNFVDVGGQASRAVRIGIAVCVAIGLAYLVFTKLFARFWREFSDPAVALVLERRFPKELGDRLITAVELADPKKAESYGFSRDMLAKTVNEAADRVERLPVADVFDWRRLRRQWLRVGFTTVGMFLLVMAGTLGIQAARGMSASPIDQFWRFVHTASIWTERNVLLRDSYWLRNAQLEVVRFQDNSVHPNEMRVGREEARPDLVVRTVAWVAPDANAIGGWRALKVAETPAYVPQEVLAKIDIPANWPGWIVDLDDLDPQIPAGAVPASVQGKRAGDAFKDLANDPSALAAVEKLNDWKTWSLDKLLLQTNRPDVREQLEKAYPAALEAIGVAQALLEEQAASPRMNRRLRKLSTPAKLTIYFRGRTIKSDAPGTFKADQKFAFGLDDLKESVTFYVRGGDAFTPPLRITLVPPPSVREIGLDKEEPAYLFHWLGGSQQPLKGKRQVFRDVKASVTGETTAIDVPLGTNLKVHALVDRPLKEEIRIRPTGQLREAGILVPENKTVTRDGDGRGFWVQFDNVDKTMEFQFEFHDDDNVKGKRKIRIRPIDDQAPDILNFELSVVLRKARFKDNVRAAGGGLDGLLITPDALLPFAGTVRDDVGLTDVRWVFETQPITIEAGKDKEPGRIILQGTPAGRRASLVVSALHFSPVAPIQALAATSYLKFVSKVIAIDLDQKAEPERSAPLAGFVEALKAKEEETPSQVDANLTGKPAGATPFLREHTLKDREYFSIKQQFPNLKMKDASGQAQIFHALKLSVAATDNNVETGPSTSRTRTPLFFLIVSEPELLAQIAREEEALRDRLDKVSQKLKAAQTTMDAQLPTMRAAKPETDFALVALRVDEVRKALLDAGSSTREINADYNRILQELEVNRVRKDKFSDVQNKIVRPLDEITNPANGNFARLEDILQRLSGALDDDLAAKRLLPKLPEHVKTASQASDEIATLVREIEQILNAISGGIDDTRLLEIVLRISQEQQNVGRPLQEVHDDILRRIFEKLQNPN